MQADEGGLRRRVREGGLDSRLFKRVDVARTIEHVHAARGGDVAIVAPHARPNSPSAEFNVGRRSDRSTSRQVPLVRGPDMLGIIAVMATAEVAQIHRDYHSSSPYMPQ